MKTTKFALALVVFIALSLPAHADPITYVINFTTTFGGPAPGSGSFTYDSTSPLFTNFLVDWNGAVYDLTASANAPFVLSTCTAAAPTASYGFAIMSHTVTGCNPSYAWVGGIQVPGTSFPAAFIFYAASINGNALVQDRIGTSSTLAVGASGDWTITPVPEPDTLLLLGTGLLGVVGAIRRKWLA